MPHLWEGLQAIRRRQEARVEEAPSPGLKAEQATNQRFVISRDDELRYGPDREPAFLLQYSLSIRLRLPFLSFSTRKLRRNGSFISPERFYVSFFSM
jgi:hypothetical protein